jgi:NAD(P)-dependent dehydrogenase (short-subunit alcohol dehydrogenase family)
MAREAGSLQGRVAVVTGGAAGIGAATVRKFVTEGANVVIGDMNVEAGKALVAEFTDRGLGHHVRFQPVDVSEETQVIELMNVALTDFGGIDIVFNNAGIGGAIGPLLELEVAHWDQTFAVMTRGVFLGIKHGGRAMQKSGKGGSIINTASIAALSGSGGPLAYSATKAAVVNITMNAATELAHLNIRVNAVCPGIIFTDLMHRGRAEEAAQTIEKIQPLPIRGDPEHIASMVRFLASDESAFVTGTTQVVDGGYLAQGSLGVHPLPGVTKRPHYSGMNYGTTGKENEIRYLEPKMAPKMEPKPEA